ncbi:methyltransferase [Mycobacterium montefiorense]|uniref:Hydroxyneurosporene-O-methyltransferase n=1 Tax=Mycobacterium montefiorense TaxID=154654 RepID=A0AA37PRI9_9MYCO|nr:methyltransferase [Mycobacterium montefiorense]GBG39398.1 hydroxyneurosporene-O-methyltransferase [Mycobacterium montefiorense]GKU33225.1 hydroxyneurosporene-O-methyltransferase [Mycobacterium montefiorense]GKU42260.1 hydroxyneurosporene-O-methyltransferase [Mycobacterium montefiorense]GKU44192.1 hydroxyneurosporene-O-methyltransferase [Mycobacterium montefiorense]GKU53185.1 hydroxyneurosporene-O-methyltransferase [Mycobacterium montefiorense]
MFSVKFPQTEVMQIVGIARHHLGRLHQRMVPPPAAMVELVMSAWAAQAITAVADLRIADALANGPLSADELADAVDADADSLARLLRALIGRGVFRQLRDGRYALNPLAETLRSDSEVSMRGFVRFLGAPEHREHWSHLTTAIRTRRAVVQEMRGKPIFDYLAEEKEFDEVFNDAMTSASELAIAPVVAGYDFSRYSTIVDVAGGHGRLLAAILNATPQARGILFDQPHVVADAAPLLKQHRVADRVRVAEGSFFETITEGGDAYVLKHIVHDWPDDEALQILRNVRKAAGAGKHVLLVEMVLPGHDRDFMGNWLDLEVLVEFDARERTAAGYAELLNRAGFRMTRVVPTASVYSVVEAVAV